MKLTNGNILCFFLVVMLFCSCGGEKVTQTEDTLTKYFQSDFSVCAESKVGDAYKDADSDRRALIEAFLKSCSVSNVVNGESGAISGTLQYPDVTSVMAGLSEQPGFAQDYKNAKLTKTEENIIERYVAHLIEEGSDRVDANVSYQVTGDGILLSDSFIADKMSSILQGVLSKSFKFTDSSKKSTTPDVVYENLDEDKDFVIVQNKTKVLISDLNILRRDEAVTELEKLSELNSDLGYDWVLVKYTVTNLSNKKSLIKNGFKAVKNDKVLKTARSVSGTVEAKILKSHKSGKFICAIAMPEDAELIWYSGKGSKAYKIIDKS